MDDVDEFEDEEVFLNLDDVLQGVQRNDCIWHSAPEVDVISAEFVACNDVLYNVNELTMSQRELALTWRKGMLHHGNCQQSLQQ